MPTDTTKTSASSGKIATHKRLATVPEQRKAIKEKGGSAGAAAPPTGEAAAPPALLLDPKKWNFTKDKHRKRPDTVEINHNQQKRQ